MQLGCTWCNSLIIITLHWSKLNYLSEKLCLTMSVLCLPASILILDKFTKFFPFSLFLKWGHLYIIPRAKLPSLEKMPAVCVIAINPNCVFRIMVHYVSQLLNLELWQGPFIEYAFLFSSTKMADNTIGKYGLFAVTSHREWVINKFIIWTIWIFHHQFT